MKTDERREIEKYLHQMQAENLDHQKCKNWLRVQKLVTMKDGKEHIDNLRFMIKKFKLAP